MKSIQLFRSLYPTTPQHQGEKLSTSGSYGTCPLNWYVCMCELRVEVFVCMTCAFLFCYMGYFCLLAICHPSDCTVASGVVIVVVGVGIVVVSYTGRPFLDGF